MELASSFDVIPSNDEERPGAFALFPYDRELVQRFRASFPRARWRGAEQGWFVPGTTATRRLNKWMTQELETLDRHADAKGHDAFLFEPLESPYLVAGEDLMVRTPYSRTIVEILRSIPWARWDPDGKIWRVPFQSYEELQARWPEIEEAARRNEPAERKRRRDEKRNHGPDPASLMQAAERRRRRYPVPGDDLPPLKAPVATFSWGVIVFEDIEDIPISETSVRNFYPHIKDNPTGYVWARWRMPGLHEVYRARPAKMPEDPELRAYRGWWWPTRDELQGRARKLREMERALRSRHESWKTPEET